MDGLHCVGQSKYLFKDKHKNTLDEHFKGGYNLATINYTNDKTEDSVTNKNNLKVLT